MEASMDELKKLRRRVAEEQAQGRGQGKHYSEALRQDVSAYLRAARAKGKSPHQLGPALGLSLPTAYQWSSKGKRERKQKAFQRMAIVARPTARSGDGEATTAATQIVVTGPGGLQAVGLGVSELAELLRRLGC
jgi:hypothetical protein